MKTKFKQTVKHLLIVLSAMLITTAAMNISAYAQSQTGIWKDITETSAMKSIARPAVISHYRTVSIDASALHNLLSQAPMEFQNNIKAKTSGIVFSLPMPDGTMEKFSIVESPIMEQALADQFPEIKTYVGQGVDDPAATVRFGWTQHGFHALIINMTDWIFIEPYSKGNLENYMVYFKSDVPFPADWNFNEEGLEKRKAVDTDYGTLKAPSGTNLRTYRLAVSATAEFTAANGGTVGGAIAAITTIVNQDDAIYEREVAVRFVLVGNNSKLVFFNAATDYFTNTAGVPCSTPIRSENQTACDDSIGSANYDIGHVFTGTNIGGCASIGSVCGGSKGWGASGVGWVGSGAFDISLSCHEMGHQFGANHTFNSNIESCSGGQYNGPTAYEPGSGSTIMSYAGGCHNIQNNRDMFFHTISFDEIIAFTVSGGGNACASTTATGNNPPSVNAGAGGFTIPINTPFTLTGSATDPDSDPLTYSWEEFDLGPTGAPTAPVGTAPIFRSFPPVNSPSRTFPQISDIINNTSTLGEILPSYTRAMNFRLTARDNRAGGGGVDYASMSFNVDASAGPFVITSPNTAVSWCVGNSETVTWNVANTTAAPVSCANVNIKLSIDGGLTYPVTILAGTPNDGTQSITVPDNPVVSNARIRVEGAGNVFFDISNADFTINKAPAVTAQPSSVAAEWGDNVSFTSTASGQPAPTVQWQLSTDGGGSFNNMAGETSTTLNLTCVTLGMNGNQYQAVFTNVCGTATSNAATLTVTPRTTTGTVTIIPNPQQYSDLVTFNITLSNAVICGEQAAHGADIYVGTQFMGSVALSVNGANMEASLANIALLEPTPFGTAPTGNMAPGVHTVTVVFTGVNSNFSVSNATAPLTITPEDARAYYTGANFASTLGANNGNAIVTLAATFKDITAVLGDAAYDPYPGDLRNATISFINRDNNTIIAANVPFGLVNPADPTIAVAVYNWNVNIGAASSQTFTVGIIIGGYYIRNSSADNTVVTVAKPLPNFISGGGYIVLSASAGIKAGDAGSNNNFGFSLKFNQSGNNLQGNMNTIIRRTETDGLHIYQIKANVMTSLVVQPLTVGGTATFNGKANIRDITNPLAPVSVDGNATMQVKMRDNGEPGTSDSIAITIWNKQGGLWYSSNWNSTLTIRQVLAAGNLRLNSNNSFDIEFTDGIASEDLTIYPNPANEQVTIDFNSSRESIYNLKMVDVIGKLMFSENIAAVAGMNTRMYDVSEFSKGMYYMILTGNGSSDVIKIIVQ
ncbi:MAG TPA: M12 family metallo-peptidase [Bacteroidia bacterium]|nr:M12 family metallo-peptidase [Bacteroidia bacterium]